MRVGIGYDIHRFAADRPCILGGIKIPSDIGPLAHSDGDVLIHAIADAVLGALSLGDIGQHFPDTAKENKNMDSAIILKKAKQLIEAKGYRIGNIDSTVVTEVPRLAKHIPAIVENLAKILAIPGNCVSVKATTHEKLGALGRSEGIAAMAIVSLQEISGE